MLQTIRTDMNEKQFQNETYVKILPPSDETSIINNQNGTSPDNEQLSREDLKFSGKILFLLSNKFYF